MVVAQPDEKNHTFYYSHVRAIKTTNIGCYTNLVRSEHSKMVDAVACLAWNSWRVMCVGTMTNTSLLTST